MSRKVVGYHGTLWKHAEAMAEKRFDPAKDANKYRWLGRGLYFFEDNIDLATAWALRRAAAADGERAAVLQAEIDLSTCLDLTRNGFRQIVIEAQDLAERRGKLAGIQQEPLTIVDGVVKAGFSGEWKKFGWNRLDYEVVEEAIILAHEKYAMDLDTVRSIFLEGKEIFRTSFVFTESAVVIAVRNPLVRLDDLRAIRV